MALFGAAALVAVAYFELAMTAARDNSRWLIPYALYILLTAGVARAFASWYGKGSDVWVALTLVPIAIIGVSTMITGIGFLLVGSVIWPSERPVLESGPLWAPLAIGVLGAITFTRAAWPALLIVHFAAAAIAWRLGASRVMRSNNSLERGRGG